LYTTSSTISPPKQGSFKKTIDPSDAVNSASPDGGGTKRTSLT
jgi:hypothetical protein